MRERETRWRQKARQTGGKQIAVWLDVDTYQALQTLIQTHNLGGMGEAIRLPIDPHQQAQEPLQAVQAEGVNPALKTADQPRLDRQPHTRQCECRTSKGGRCRNRAVEIIKVRVSGVIAEYGTCKRHKRYFEPHQSIM